MKSISQLLAAYDDELRTEAETPSAVEVRMLGPLRLVTFARGRGFVTYQDLAGADAAAIRQLVINALEYYRAQPSITKVEWKSRGHDHAPGLHQALLDSGFVEGESESIMIGEAQLLATHVPLPPGVTLRTIQSDEEIARMSQMQADVFGDLDPEPFALALSERLARKDGMELWVAEARGEIVCSGRLEPVRGTAFAGIWGGATRPAWRGRGIYRALTAARTRAALAVGKEWLHSDSTEFSRPILERAGLVRVSTTTPYVWTRSEV
jgi:GNAT superfamily N-acetyltransferase